MFFIAPKKDFLYSDLFFLSSVRISMSLFISVVYQSIIYLICLYMYMYMYLCVYMYIYIYIYGNASSHFIEVVK